MVVQRTFLGVSAVWAALIPLAAFAASRHSAGSEVYAFALAVYGVGHFVCHQLPMRSFHLWRVALPVCARCTGIYLGAAATAIVRGAVRAPQQTARASRRERRIEPRVVLLIALAPTAATLVFEWTTGVMPANWIRALAGAPLGAAVAWAIGMVN